MKSFKDYIKEGGEALDFGDPEAIEAEKDTTFPIPDYYRKKGIKSWKQMPKIKRQGPDTQSTAPTMIKAHYELEEEQKLNKPFRTPGGPKKFSVYVKNEKGNTVKVNFGDPNMEIKRDDPNRRKSFRARHNCENPGPKTKARYWSCYQWRNKAKVED